MESSYSTSRRWEMGGDKVLTLGLSSLNLIARIFQNAVCIKIHIQAI